jgi:AraC-like DNA-binding protein
MDANYHEPIDLQQVSGTAFLSRFHFHRLFTSVYKKTPHQYLTFRRIEKAKELLAENRPVKEVCQEVGFDSLPSFSSLFKKESGYAPQCYRNQAFRKKQQSAQAPRTVVPHCFLEMHKI